MSEIQQTPAQAAAALEALNQAYAYYTPAPYVAAQADATSQEYYEYAAAA
ncbi:hypothetical protein [Thalassovita sp.]|nr:hypothetical protein [Thalassovita sp.]MDF1802899.1 hypothetical protein [Thalassovita sp.]